MRWDDDGWRSVRCNRMAGTRRRMDGRAGYALSSRPLERQGKDYRGGAGRDIDIGTYDAPSIITYTYYDTRIHGHGQRGCTIIIISMETEHYSVLDRPLDIREGTSTEPAERTRNTKRPGGYQETADGPFMRGMGPSRHSQVANLYTYVSGSANAHGDGCESVSVNADVAAALMHWRIRGSRRSTLAWRASCGRPLLTSLRLALLRRR